MNSVGEKDYGKYFSLLELNMTTASPQFIGFPAFAQRNPDKPALIFEPSGLRMTYGQLDAQANQYAHAFRSLGLANGDCMSICLPNCISLVAAILAAQRIGIYFTLIAPKASAADIAYITTDSGSKLLLTSADTASPVESSPGAYQRIICSPNADGQEAWDKLAAAQPATLPANPKPGMEMIYSSGTTGRPKGIRRDFQCKTWGEVDTRNIGALAWFAASQSSVYLSTSPLYHSAPHRFMMAFLDAGSTVVVMEHFDPQLSLRCIDRYGCTHSVWVPTMFQRLLRLEAAERAGYSGKTMTHAIHGAAPCAQHVKQSIIDWWGPIIYEYYSGTEGVGRTFIDSAEWLAHPGSVGKPSGCIVHILDPQGDELGPRQIGDIFFESPVTFTYWNDQEKTRASESRQGWRTYGDIGFVDEAGYLYLTDRSSFMVISGGVNIYPQEIENNLLAHPEVVDAAVFGVPDDDLGEKLVAVVQLNSGLTGDAAKAIELQEFCRQQGGSIKTPRLLRFCTVFPRLDTGKVQKRFLREQLVREPQPWAAVGQLLVAQP